MVKSIQGKGSNAFRKGCATIMKLVLPVSFTIYNSFRPQIFMLNIIQTVPYEKLFSLWICIKEQYLFPDKIVRENVSGLGAGN